MIRPLIPPDLIRFLFLTQSEKTNRAVTVDSLLADRGANLSLLGASKSSIPIRGKSCVWLSSESRRPNGFAIAKRMSGRQSWNVSHLVLKDGANQFLPELLERVAKSAGSSGAQKVFIRLLRGDPLVDTARLSGYFPHVPEVLYIRDSPLETKYSDATSLSPNISISPRTESDDHGLFRLYNATTPAEVRYAVGMTIDQWLASHEIVAGRSEEFVLKNGGEIVGWLGVVRKSGNGHVATMIHPDHERSLPSLVDHGLRRLDVTKKVLALAPEYQIAFQTTLAERGFRASSDYVTLIKTMTIKEKEKAYVRVAAPTGS